MGRPVWPCQAFVEDGGDIEGVSGNLVMMSPSNVGGFRKESSKGALIPLLFKEKP